MKDSEILAGLVSDFEAGCCTEEKIATLRKYAAIARAVEEKRWQLVPTEASPAMLSAIYEWSTGRKPTPAYLRKSTWVFAEGHRAMLQAAPQFQEEGK